MCTIQDELIDVPPDVRSRIAYCPRRANIQLSGQGDLICTIQDKLIHVDPEQPRCTILDELMYTLAVHGQSQLMHIPRQTTMQSPGVQTLGA